MAPSNLPPNEAERLSILRAYDVLDTACEAAFDNIVYLASKLTGNPISLISLIDADRQWFKAKVGIDVTETPREQAFCAHAILQPHELMVVPDARADPRFSENPMVLGAPWIRFYAGAPLVSPEGAALGTLCVINSEPHEMSETQRQDLRRLADTAMTTLELRRALSRMRGLARHDSLTGLLSRPALIEIIDQAIDQQKRDGKAFSLLYADLDGFKEINDSLGHGVGDQVLSYVASALNGAMRQGDTLGRIGGDEFAAVLVCSESDAVLVAERARAEVEDRMRANDWAVTISIGVASFVQTPGSADNALARADKLMYAAKLHGKNRVYNHTGAVVAPQRHARKFSISDFFHFPHVRHMDGHALWEHHLAPQILERSKDGILVADLSDKDLPIVHVNQAFEDITGYSRAEVSGKNCRYLQGSDRLQPEIMQMRDAIAKRVATTVTLRNYRKDGSLFWNELTLCPILSGKGKPTHFVGLMRDVTATRDLAQRLEAAAHRDRLTGVYNRDKFIDELGRLQSSYNGRLFVAKLALDGLHDVNTCYGYDVGDELIKQSGQRLLRLGADIVGRIGDNKFAVAVRLENRVDGQHFLAALCAALRPELSLPGVVLRPRVALGYVIDEHGTPAETLARHAATALHQSRQSSMRRPFQFDLSSDRIASQKLRLTVELQQAVANRDFVHYYQPKVDLRTGQLIGAEALIRWKHVVFGIQYPDTFIPLAEETGMIIEIDAFGLRHVAAFAARINKNRATPLVFSVNISPLDLTNSDIVEVTREALRNSGAQPAWITLELTEGLMTDGSPELIDIFERLRALGVGLSIDDFGTGNSSLRYLDSFPISEIKIDRSFVRDLAASGTKRIIAETVVALGRHIGASVVAEGIETEDEMAALLDLGCLLGQGYLFSKPVDEASFEKMAA